MAYLRQYQMRGDPFLGGLIKGIGHAFGALTGLARPTVAFPKVLPGIGEKIAAKAAKFPGGKKGLGIAAGALGAGALGGAGAEALLGRHMGRKRRHMRVTNVKALRRSMRRVEGFARLAKKTITFTKHTRMKHRRKR